MLYKRLTKVSGNNNNKLLKGIISNYFQSRQSPMSVLWGDFVCVFRIWLFTNIKNFIQFGRAHWTLVKSHGHSRTLGRRGEGWMVAFGHGKVFWNKRKTLYVTLMFVSNTWSLRIRLVFFFVFLNKTWFWVRK